MNRRGFLQLAGMALPLVCRADGSDPWSPSDLIEPADLAKQLASGNAPHIICVAFPVLYRQRHIAGAVLAGPGGKPEGISTLDATLKDLNREQRIVLYCGCCPMERCPNIRPAYSEARKLGFTNASVLRLPTNFHTDWVAKGFPVDQSAS